MPFFLIDHKAEKPGGQTIWASVLQARALLGETLDGVLPYVDPGSQSAPSIKPNTVIFLHCRSEGRSKWIDAFKRLSVKDRGNAVLMLVTAGGDPKADLPANTKGHQNKGVYSLLMTPAQFKKDSNASITVEQLKRIAFPVES